MKDTVFRICALIAIFAAGPAAAQPFWEDVSDALWRIHVEEEPVEDQLYDLLAKEKAGRSTMVIPTLPDERSAEVNVFNQEINGSRFQLFAGGIDNLPVGFFLEFGPDDHRIPGLRGSIGNCYEGAPSTCVTRSVQHRSDYKLGNATCQCGRIELLRETTDGATIGVNCYFGRPGSYMSYLFGYGPVPQSAALELSGEEVDGPIRQSLCSGSDDPINDRQQDGNDMLRLAPSLGLFPNALPRFVAVGRMGDDIQLDPKTIAMVVAREKPAAHQ